MLRKFARPFGKGSSEFERERIQAKKEIGKLHEVGNVTREELESIAAILRIDYIGKDGKFLYLFS